eukprot:PhF_6_TR23249/c3_g1_i2/m.32629
MAGTRYEKSDGGGETDDTGSHLGGFGNDTSHQIPSNQETEDRYAFRQRRSPRLEKLPQDSQSLTDTPRHRVRQNKSALHTVLGEEGSSPTPRCVGQRPGSNRMSIQTQTDEHPRDLHRKFHVERDRDDSGADEDVDASSSSDPKGNSRHSNNNSTTSRRPTKSSAPTGRSSDNRRSSASGNAPIPKKTTPDRASTSENRERTNCVSHQKQKESVASLISSLEGSTWWYDTPMWGMDPELQKFFRTVNTQSDEQSSWELDAPPVDTMDLEALKQQFGNPKLNQALSLITSPTEFESLFRRKVTKKVGRTSLTIVRGMRKLIANDYVAPETRPKAKIGLFTRPKPKKHTLRMLVNAIPVNYAQTPPPHVALPGLQQVKTMVTKYDFITELDGTSFFNQFKLHSDIRKWFSFNVGRHTWAWKRMPMGWAHSVFIAQAASEALTHGLTDVEVLVYIDNIYIFGKTREQVENAKAQFLHNCAKVRATFETSTPTGTTCKVLGMDVDLVNKTVQLSANTVEKLKMLAEHFDMMHDQRLLTNHTLWIILGNVLWGARILEEPMCRFPNLTAWVSEQSTKLAWNEDMWKHRVRLWPKAKRQLHDLLEKLCRNEPWTPPPVEGVSHTLYIKATIGGPLC